MTRIKILDCTLRDGGYITKWVFKRENILRIAEDLTNANLDLIELGYLNKDVIDLDKSIFQNIYAINEVIPKDRKNSMFLAMADIDQFLPENLQPRTKSSIDGIRVVFYKHQIEKALIMCKAVADNGYKLFVQPMVTIDYTPQEYADLILKISALNPYAVSIVDSFGYMSKNELKMYYNILDEGLAEDVTIGFHSHNNMQLSVLNADSLFSYPENRQIIIDSSLYGMGRGAGNLNTELIINYYNENVGNKYALDIVMRLIGDVIYPIYKKTQWGYSPYFFLTALYKCHPNYVTYLLEEKDVTVNEFEEYIQTLPQEMKLKCRKPNVIEWYEKYKNEKDKHND